MYTVLIKMVGRGASTSSWGLMCFRDQDRTSNNYTAGFMKRNVL